MKCIIDGCENEINSKSRLTTCSTCRQGLNYWMKFPAVRVLERQRKLRMWNNRLDTLSISPSDVKGRITVKTVVAKRKRK